MAVPGFQEMFLPCLRFLADGAKRPTAEIRCAIASAMKLSDAAIGETLGSGTSRFHNRVAWCQVHLLKAGLIERVDRGVYRITDAGRRLAENPPPRLDLRFLDTIPQHKAWFHQPKPDEAEDEAARRETAAEIQPPDERMEEASDELNMALAAELKQAMAKMDPFRFEQLVVDLLFAMGYGGSRKEAAQVTKKTNDEGIDGVINEDRLGLDTIYIQAKRWQNPVGRKEIQSFVGALAGQSANKGVFITTSTFHSTAIEYAENLAQKVVLIDGTRLAELMIEHNIGVSTTRTFALKRLDADYFAEG